MHYEIRGENDVILVVRNDFSDLLKEYNKWRKLSKAPITLKKVEDDKDESTSM